MGAPNPKRCTQSLKRSGALQRADLDRADVARASQDLRGAQRFFRVFGVVVDRLFGDLDLVGDVEWRGGRDQPRFERARHGHHLERRARFIVEAHRPVLERFGRRGARVIGVHLRPVRQCEDRTGARVHHDRCGVFRPVHLRDGAKHVFGALLDVGVKRQRQRLRRNLLVGFADRHRLAERVADDAPLAGATGEDLLREYSRPASPSPSVPTTPSTCAASVARGYTRRITGVPVTPLSFSASTACAWRAGSARAR